MRKTDRRRAQLIATLQQGHTYEFTQAVEALAVYHDDEVVDALLAALRKHVKQNETYTPGKLAMSLATIAKPVAIQPVIDAMANRAAWKREDIEKALVRFGAQAIAPLIGALQSEDPHIREGAVGVLSRLGETAVAPLLMTLTEGRPISQRGAAQALGRIADLRALDPLISTLVGSTDDELVAAAATALGHLTERHALEPLLTVANHPSAAVRAAVATALRVFPDAATVQSLISLLNDDAQYVGVAAKESLIHIGVPAVDLLSSHLLDENELLRSSASEALVRINGIALYPVLESLKHENPRVRASAASSLGAFKLSYPRDYTELSEPGTPSHGDIVEQLLSALEDPDFRVRKASARSLGIVYEHVKFLILRGEINVDRIVDGLSTLVERQSELARQAAAESLLEVAVEPGPIVRLLKHPDPTVRDAMVNAIRRYFARLDVAHGYFPSWLSVSKDFYHVWVGESARLMMTALIDTTQDSQPRVRADAIEAVRVLRAKLLEKRVSGDTDIQYSWRGPIPPSELGDELTEEKELATAVENAVTQQSARTSVSAVEAVESDRFTDLTIYEGHLYRGDDLSRETRLSDDVPLAAEERYSLEVAVRRKRTGIDADIEALPVGNPRQDKEVLTIFVLAESKCASIVIRDSFARVSWPYDADSDSALFRPTVRGVEPANRGMQGVIQVRVYDGALDLLDSVNLTVTIVSEGSELWGSDAPVRTLTWPERTRGRSRFDPNSPCRSLSIDVSLELSTQKYSLLFKFLRKDEKRSVVIPGTTTMTAEDVDGLLASIRDFWTELVITNYEYSLTVTNSTFTEYLKRLRRLGMRAWTLLFGAGYAAQEGSSEVIGKLLGEIALEQGTYIQITGNGGDLIFPWSVLHPPEAESSPVNPLNFWGARYLIEQVTEGPKYDSLTEEPITVLFALDRNFGNSEAQEKLLHGYEVTAGKRLIVTAPISDERSLFHELARKPSVHLVYCFCHGYAPGTGNVFRRDGVKLLKERIEALEENTPARKALETLLTLTAKMDNEAWMFIGGAEIRESSLNLQSFFETRRPIVILNMCQSAELLPSMSGGLVRTFLKHNASAVVGTECPMTAFFADAFAKTMLDSLFRGDDIGTALWKARRYYLSRVRNPLGLAYTLYGRAIARLGTGSILPETLPPINNDD